MSSSKLLWSEASDIHSNQESPRVPAEVLLLPPKFQPLPLQQEDVEHLKSVMVDEKDPAPDPAVVLEWQHHAVRLFVEKANSIANLPVRPNFLCGVGGPIDEDTLMTGIVAHLATRAGGFRGNSFVAPCTFPQQFMAVITLLENHIQLDPWFQTIASAMVAQQEPTILARIRVVRDRSHLAAGEFVHLVPPIHGAIPLFE